VDFVIQPSRQGVQPNNIISWQELEFSLLLPGFYRDRLWKAFFLSLIKSFVSIKLPKVDRLWLKFRAVKPLTPRTMDLILCHTTADFDALGAAVGLTRLKPGAKLVLTGGAHPAVRDFLALHRDEYALVERRSVNPKQIQSLVVVDTQKRDRLGKAAEWFDLPHLTAIEIYDHHLDIDSDIPPHKLSLSQWEQRRL
jgi:hypothetical protein